MIRVRSRTRIPFKGGGWGAGILGVISIVLGLILMGDYGKIGSGLAMLWAGAIWASKTSGVTTRSAYWVLGKE